MVGTSTGALIAGLNNVPLYNSSIPYPKNMNKENKPLFSSDEIKQILRKIKTLHILPANSDHTVAIITAVIFGVILILGCSSGSSDPEVDSAFEKLNDWIEQMEKGMASGSKGPTKEDVDKFKELKRSAADQLDFPQGMKKLAEGFTTSKNSAELR